MKVIWLLLTVVMLSGCVIAPYGGYGGYGGGGWHHHHEHYDRY